MTRSSPSSQPNSDSAPRLNPTEAHQAARYRWLKEARPKQITPAGDWFAWLVQAGRGYGKTRVGAEDMSEFARTHPGSRLALVAETFSDGRDTMVEGESGLLSVIPHQALRDGSVSSAWNRSLGELYLHNGCKFKIYSSEKPGQLRGPQHHRAWADELAKFKDAAKGDQEDTTFTNLLFGLRLGDDPRLIITTTPKRNALVRSLMKMTGVVITRGSTYENLDNLAPPFKDQILSRYEGTRLGRQELLAELIEDVEGALWTQALIDKGRVEEHPDLVRVIVAVDPSGGDAEGNDEQGIVVAGLGVDGEAYVLADRSCKLSPDGWGRRAVQAYLEFQADRIVGETNFGGDLVISNVETAAKAMGVTVATKKITASRGKAQRAEPVAALYGDPDNVETSRPRVHHVGSLPVLEDQQTTWTPEDGWSPDRMDALVWALTELMVQTPSAWRPL